jgi:hypothetical protein
MRDAYLAAELAVTKGQSYRLGTRDLTLADLGEIRLGRAEWERRANAEQASSAGMNPLYSLADFSGCGR